MSDRKAAPAEHLVDHAFGLEGKRMTITGGDDGRIVIDQPTSREYAGYIMDCACQIKNGADAGPLFERISQLAFHGLNRLLEHDDAAGAAR